jgi:hypothetical protein
MRNGKTNPKNYPYWRELVQLLGKEYIVNQVGKENEELIDGCQDFRGLNLKILPRLIHSCYTWISVDNFFPHFVMSEYGSKKPGVVLWGKSDRFLFGYENNTNLFKDGKYLRKNQFDIWETETHDPNAFVTPDRVMIGLLECCAKVEYYREVDSLII